MRNRTKSAASDGSHPALPAWQRGQCSHKNYQQVQRLCNLVAWLSVPLTVGQAVDYAESLNALQEEKCNSQPVPFQHKRAISVAVYCYATSSYAP